MNKEEIKELFQDSLDELSDVSKDIQKIGKLTDLVFDNIDLLKDDVTEEDIVEISSSLKIKVSELSAVIKDALSDSKRLESLINEIKLLKRKREKKLNSIKEINDFDDGLFDFEDDDPFSN